MNLSRSRHFLRMALALIFTAGLAASGAQASPVGIQAVTSVVEPPSIVPAHVFIAINNRTFDLVVDCPIQLPCHPKQGVPFSIDISSAVPSVVFSFSDNFGSIETPNRVQFTPGPIVDVSAGQEFLLGTFRLTNGTWFGDADIGIFMRTFSQDPALNGHTFTNTLHMEFNPFDPNPLKSGDYFISSRPVMSFAAW